MQTAPLLVCISERVALQAEITTRFVPSTTHLHYLPRYFSLQLLCFNKAKNGHSEQLLADAGVYKW